VALGADIAMDAAAEVPERLMAENKKMADAVILCTSATVAVNQAWQSVDKGGVVVFFAVPGPDKQVRIPINEFWMKEIKILTSYYCGPEDIAEALRLLDQQLVQVDDLITHVLPLAGVAKGFKLVADGGRSIKVIIKP